MTLLLPCFAGALKVVSPPGWWPQNWSGFFAWATANQFWILVGLPLGAAALTAIEKLLEWRIRARTRDERFRKMLECLLEVLRAELVPSELSNAPAVDHRLTLYRANLRRKRLEIVARSAEATRGSGTTWQIDPDDQDRCEGVAGVGWYRDHPIVTPPENEPPLPDVSDTPTNEEVERYARITFVTPERVRSEKWRARSFATLTIRIDGKRWGVLVLDSVAPGAARAKIQPRYQFAADMLGHIIKAWSEA